ncbi:PaaI family thioesterase [Sulfitobacter aestuariivivens]|uniref:PaaI family thioesterase n=1 Tax=Sulfitobacter aestuariivivens TaxID=2766981 RepID=A0A927HCM7_9RHOB|nr:PaaI family thioesterase [Sulfitobacter aestuariivivens]MBD3662722.1 PaaI family thioesterase [Sulfitobacter aestuariivivens]
MTPADAQTFLDDNFAPWVRALDICVSEVTPEKTALRMPITDALNRTGGIISGQALTALADTAMVLACGGHAGEMMPVGTVTLDTQFLRPGTGDAIRAEAEVTRAGRSMIFTRCTLIAEPSEKPVALATATFAR